MLVVGVPGWDRTRMSVESELARRGWAAATSPADADVLVLCGIPGTELRSVFERTWLQLPGPRARADVTAPENAAAALDQAAAHLLDEPAQRSDERMRPRQPLHDSEDKHSMQHSESGDHGLRSGHAGMDMGPGPGPGVAMDDPATDMGSDDMAMDMDMPMPGGIPLAGGGPDRDGLEMDLLHVPLGPLLPHWPSGLVVRCVMQGDVIVSAESEVLAAGAMPPTRAEPQWTALDRAEELRRSGAIRNCDYAARLLALSGWDTAALQVQRIRNGLLEGEPLVDCARSLSRLGRRVQRSWLLGWSLSGIGEDGAEIGSADRQHYPGTARNRLVGWLDEALRLVQGEEAPESQADDAAVQRRLLGTITRVVTGSDVATARLAVASLGIDTGAITPVEEHAHG